MGGLSCPPPRERGRAGVRIHILMSEIKLQKVGFLTAGSLSYEGFLKLVERERKASCSHQEAYIMFKQGLKKKRLPPFFSGPALVHSKVLPTDHKWLSQDYLLLLSGREKNLMFPSGGQHDDQIETKKKVATFCSGPAPVHSEVLPTDHSKWPS